MHVLGFLGLRRLLCWAIWLDGFYWRLCMQISLKFTTYSCARHPLTLTCSSSSIFELTWSIADCIILPYMVVKNRTNWYDACVPPTFPCTTDNAAFFIPIIPWFTSLRQVISRSIHIITDTRMGIARIFQILCTTQCLAPMTLRVWNYVLAKGRHRWCLEIWERSVLLMLWG